MAVQFEKKELVSRFTEGATGAAVERDRGGHTEGVDRGGYGGKES